MLEIDVVTEESFDETTQKFGTSRSFKVRLEHSLFSVSKWESLWEEVFLGKKEKTQEQTLSYIELMILDDNTPPEVFHKLVENHLKEVNDYVGAKMTATTIPNDPNAQPSRDVITSELVYYWMISMNIPMECQHWHLNRLFMLMRVISLKNSPKKKMSAKERQQLNRTRQQQYNTRG